jgi:hypothetical protein
MATPGPSLLEDNRFRCYEGSIGFALDVISQWHKELAFVLRFLHSMEAMPAYHSTEYALPADNGNDTRFPVAAKYNRGGDSRAVKSPTRAPKEGTSSAQPPRTQLPTREPNAPMRRMERTTAGDPAPRAVRMDVGCEGCGRKGHTAEQCKCKRHPSWNSQHATVKWKDCAVAQEIKVLTNGEVRFLPLDGVQWIPADRL